MKQTDMSRTARAGSCAVQTAGLTKRFGGRTAVDRVDLLVPAGTAFGYLEPNGAGKTTLIRMLLGLTAPTSGSMRLLGHPVPAERSAALLRVGAMAEEPRFLGYVTGRESLRINAAAREPAARDRIEAALERAGLAGRAGEQVARYSAGMRHRPREAGLRRLDRHQLASCVSAAPFMAPVFVNAPGVSAHAGSRSRRGSL
jgi:ABC-type multidrug transport system ATPase subunit